MADLYFDDYAWVIRYLVVETGTWLSSRKVLLTPLVLGHAGLERQAVAGVNYPAAGRSRPEYRYRQPGDPAARRDLSRSLPLPLLLERPGSMTTEPSGGLA